MSKDAEQDWMADESSRRTFLKQVAVTGGAALVAGTAAYGATMVSLEGRVAKNYPDIDPDIFKPKDQRDLVLCFAGSQDLGELYPERNEQYSRLQKKDFNFQLGAMNFMQNQEPDNSRPGYTQKDRALEQGAWWPLIVNGSIMSAYTQPNTPMHSWDQSDVAKEQYPFESTKEAELAIKSAARVYGANRCGIARNDKRFNYEPLYDTGNAKTLSWEKDFPFEPKSVIVLLMPQDYDNMAASPGWTAQGTIGTAYSNMTQIAAQMAKFIRTLGYHAVGSGNDLGSGVAYAIMAGLGEGARNGSLIAPGIGPRVRICKVYTDLDFGDDYDEPHQWGITDFCTQCAKCAEACPAEAISFEPEPSYVPSYEFSDEPGYTWNNQPGAKKWHNDAKKCFNFWIDNDSGCGIASCTFNEPDYWHHLFIMGITPWMPAPVHKAMAALHPRFGYGSVNDPKKVAEFWKTGEGMRTNKRMKNNIGTSNKA